MSKLSSADRANLRPDQFAGPNRTYPIPDRSHAINAEARASEEEKKGRLTRAQQAMIDARAKAELARTKPIRRGLLAD